jgi:hypothetical protein
MVSTPPAATATCHAGRKNPAWIIDAVAIMTPGGSHTPTPRPHSMARRRLDKPVTETFAEARDHRAHARTAACSHAHAYSAYPMTRYARSLVQEGHAGCDQGGTG